jgi:hypothetical protein
MVLSLQEVTGLRLIATANRGSLSGSRALPAIGQIFSVNATLTIQMLGAERIQDDRESCIH